MDKIVIDKLRVQGFKVVEAMKVFENGQTLFKGLYNIQFKNETVLRVRESENLYSISTLVKYPTFTIKKDLTVVELIEVLTGIKNKCIVKGA